MPAPWVGLIVALWVVVIILAVLVLGVIRRIEQPQPARPARRPAPTWPTIGQPLPDVAGFELVSGPSDPRSRVFVFLSSTCAMCITLAQALRTQTVDLPGLAVLEAVQVVLVTDPDWNDPVADVVSLAVKDTGGRLREHWRIPGTPYAVAIDDSGTVRAASFINNVAELYEIAATVQAVTSA